MAGSVGFRGRSLFIFEPADRNKHYPAGDLKARGMVRRGARPAVRLRRGGSGRSLLIHPWKLPSGGQHLGFERRVDEEPSLVAQGLNLGFDRGNVTVPLRPQKDAEYTGYVQAGVGRKLPAFLLVDDDDFSLQISGERDGFGFAAVQMQGEDAE